MNFYPFHIGDYVSATRHLSWEEDAAYRRLLDTYYITEKPLPADLRAACRLVSACTDSQREAVKVVLQEFFVETGTGWVNKRADQVILSLQEKQQSQKEKANKRWSNHKSVLGLAEKSNLHMPEKEPGNAAASKIDAAASKIDAVAMPPIPIPIPIPNKNIKTESAPKTGICGASAPPLSVLQNNQLLKNKDSANAEERGSARDQGEPYDVEAYIDETYCKPVREREMLKLCEEPPEVAVRGKRLPESWQVPAAWFGWAQLEKPDWTNTQIRQMADAFKDFWIAKTGKDAAKANWEATWRNWVRRERDGTYSRKRVYEKPKYHNGLPVEI